MSMIKLLDRPIAYQRAFVGIGCGITGAVMLSQAVYWSERSSTKDGWFYKTQADWENETGLTRYEQENARKKLKNLGVLEEIKRGVPCKVHYRVNENALTMLLSQYVENQQTRMWNTSSTVCSKPASSDAEIPQTNTETTQRIPETTTDIIADKSPKPKNKKRSLPDGFLPTEQHIKLASDLGVNLNIEFQQFKDYHVAKGSKFVDWHAALRTWIRNSAKFGKPKQPARTGYLGNEQLDYSKGVKPDGTF